MSQSDLPLYTFQYLYNKDGKDLVFIFKNLKFFKSHSTQKLTKSRLASYPGCHSVLYIRQRTYERREKISHPKVLCVTERSKKNDLPCITSHHVDFRRVWSLRSGRRQTVVGRLSLNLDHTALLNDENSVDPPTQKN